LLEHLEGTPISNAREHAEGREDATWVNSKIR
jgi:hypothetical protein